MVVTFVIHEMTTDKMARMIMVVIMAVGKMVQDVTEVSEQENVHEENFLHI